MTGTAATEASEFNSIYKLPVTVVPTNQKVRRTDESDVVFSQEEGMLTAPVSRCPCVSGVCVTIISAVLVLTPIRHNCAASVHLGLLGTHAHCYS